MENPNSTASKAWFLFGISTGALLIFAGLYFFNPRTVAKVQTVPTLITNTVVTIETNEVVKEVPKEVEKIVNVPAEIPHDYVLAMKFYRRMTNAAYAGADEVLFKMKDVRINYELDDAIKQVVGEDEVKAKFELTLRRNNVPINANSSNVILVSLGGFFDSTTQNLLCYSLNCGVPEGQVIFRGGEFRTAILTIWRRGDSYGTVGRSKANEALLNEVEKEAEIFANDFLSANSKSQNRHDIFDDLSTNSPQKN